MSEEENSSSTELPVQNKLKKVRELQLYIKFFDFYWTK